MFLTMINAIFISRALKEKEMFQAQVVQMRQGLTKLERMYKEKDSEVKSLQAQLDEVIAERDNAMEKYASVSKEISSLKTTVEKAVKQSF
jgi:peptidoglycan hydrolase CwlO-like protein